MGITTLNRVTRSKTKHLGEEWGLPSHQRWKQILDEHGRFNLNALHKARGGEKSKQPSIWSVNKAAKELIAEIDRSRNSGIAPLDTIKGGSGAQGTFAHELLAVSCAGWISPQGCPAKQELG
ncbi:KilA-N domain-containing protein [Aliiroseovarius crassostreae]|uniref:KilA-N domain-containing protein n=1 Tax=Aliiroseovarius crassostreae TaxID=154981 RepID=UPI0021FA4FE0|nr:KilA-N domain-containing protein [Aliiroseovarius crassostreae]UWQ05929.1 KilA-N domain-containing protein [Aliiroseovarius crassostreae]